MKRWQYEKYEVHTMNQHGETRYPGDFFSALFEFEFLNRKVTKNLRLYEQIVVAYTLFMNYIERQIR